VALRDRRLFPLPGFRPSGVNTFPPVEEKNEESLSPRGRKSGPPLPSFELPFFP